MEINKKNTSNIESAINVSVIIVNYNTCRMTAECIDSVFEKTKDIEFEVILVDNASTDGSREYFETDNRIRYIYSYENMGFGRANNLGMATARGEYFFLLNSDTLLINNAIKMFHDFAEDRTSKAFYGCWLENEDGVYVHSCAKIPTIKTLLSNAIAVYKSVLNIKVSSGANIPYNEKQCIEVGYITGADLFLHRSLFEQTGGFDSQFFMYYEESDWQRRSKEKGFFSYCLNGPRIVHLGGGSQNGISMNLLRNYNKFKSCYYYVYKHNSIFKYIAFRIAFVFIYLPIFCFAPRLTFRNRIKAISLLVRSYTSLLIDKI